MSKIFKLFLIFVAIFGCKGNADLFKSAMENEKVQLESFIGSDGVPNYNVVGAVNIEVSKNLYQNFIKIKWEKLEGNFFYNIYRTEADAVKGNLGRIIDFKLPENPKWKKIATVENDIFYNDTSVDSMGGYCYSVKCSTDKYEGKFSAIRVGWNYSDVKNITATIKESVDYIAISWDTIPFAKKYTIYRGEAPLKDSFGNTLKPTEPVEIAGQTYKKVDESVISYYEDLTVNIAGLEKNILYFYKIEVNFPDFNTNYENSAVGKGEILPPGAVPPPAIVSASRGLGVSIIVNWSAVGASKEYVVYRATVPNLDGQPIALDEITRTTDTTFTDTTGLLEGKHYWYAVSVVNLLNDEGRSSFAVENSGGAVDEAGCRYTNEGYILSAPKPEVDFLKVKDTPTDGISVVRWGSVVAAKKYKISSNNVDWTDVDALLWIDKTSNSATTYYMKSVNVDNGLVYESAVSSVVDKRDYVCKGSEFLYEGGSENLKGVIEFEWDPIIKENFTEVKIVKNNTFKNDAIDMGTKLISENKFRDNDFPEITYTDLSANLLTINVVENIPYSEMIKKALSANYVFEFKDSASKVYSARGRGVRMFTPTEFLYLFKICDHSTCNKITNQITAIFGDPNKYGAPPLAGEYFPRQGEYDMGFFGGELYFEPVHIPVGIELYMTIGFRFYNMSDYPGIALNGVNFVYKDLTSGFVNPSNKGLNPNFTMTIADRVVVNMEERLTINQKTSVVEGGTTKMIVTRDGEAIFTYNFTDMVNLYYGPGKQLNDSNHSTNCPGGRNYTRNGKKSTGHYGAGTNKTWIDPEDCGYTARIQKYESIDVLASTGK